MKHTQASRIPLSKRLKTKILVPLLLLLILVVGSMGLILYTTSYNIIVQNTADNAFNIAASLVELIDAESFQSIHSVEDEETEAYAAIRNELSRTLAVTGSKFIYTMRKAEDGRFIYVVDGSSEEGFSHVGDVEETFDGFEEVWSGQPYRGQTIELQEDWGAMISAYCPIFDQGGAVVGFVGVDYDASVEYAGLQTFQTLALTISLAGILVSAVFGLLIANYITKPIKETTRGAHALAAGELDAPIRVRSRDEIGELAGILNNEVREAFKNIGQMHAVSDKQARYQREETKKVLANVDRLAQGDLHCNIAVGAADEDTQELHDIYAQIAESLMSAVDAMKGYINETAHVLSQLAEGNLTETVTSEYQGDFMALKDSINRIILNMNGVLSEIETAADQVADGTKQISDGSQEISQGATAQASAIEELTSSVTEIAAQTQKNAESANQANKLAGRTVTEAAHGNESMRAMQGAMEEIRDASHSISKIIKVIDDIAFQTNILALNAAVEAARAGVHGKGFAVVAEEVRNLAARSANAAKETTELIESSITKTEAGAKIADSTVSTLSSIVSSVEQAAVLVREIAHASNEQAQAIAQINKGIEQFATVVQTNSATSEEEAAAAQELSSQAEMLQNMVARFQLNRAQENYAAAQPAMLPAMQPALQRTALKSPRIHLTAAGEDFGKYSDF